MQRAGSARDGRGPGGRRVGGSSDRTSAAAATAQPAPAASATDSGPTGIQAKYAAVEDAVTGADIWNLSPDVEVPMGSITKVMTAYVVIKAGIALGRDAMALPLFASIVQLSDYHLPSAQGEHPAYTWKTTNPLIGHYDGAIGSKTGDTRAAGDCLLFEAVRNGQTVVGVVLDDPSWSDMASDSETLLDYGFSHYTTPSPTRSPKRPRTCSRSSTRGRSPLTGSSRRSRSMRSRPAVSRPI